MDIPLVTVIIPAFNCEKWIDYSIESVFRQTYRNFELIVVDDGSTDNTRSLVLKHQDRLRYIYQDNGGVSKARNTGIHHSNGEYIAFLDADDIWDPIKLELQMTCFREHPDADMICTGFRHRKNNQILERMTYESSFNLFKEYRYTIDDIFASKSSIHMGGKRYDFYWGNIYRYLFLGNFILPSSVVLKKKSLRESGLFDEKYWMAEETDFFLRYSRFNTIGFIRNPLLSYELPDSGNLSGKSNLEKLMKNAIRIQIDSILANPHEYKRNKGFFDKGLSMTYARIAYLYLSDFRIPESRRYAEFSIRTYPMYLKPYRIWLGTFIPDSALRYLAQVKRRGRVPMKGNGFSSTGSK